MRRQSIKKYDHLYTRFYHDEENRYTCFYCGEPATGFDHQPPISRVDDYHCIGLWRETYIKVPSCQECNNLASDKLTESLWDRYDLVKEKLAKRYPYADGYYGMTDAELMRFGRNLRGMIADKELKIRRAAQRIEYANGIQAYIEWYEADDTILRD